MSRALHADTSAILNDGVLAPGLLAEFTLADQVIRITSLKRDVIWDGNTFLSNGWLLPIDGVQDSAEIGNYAFDLTLNGISTALISLILANDANSRRGSVWLAFFNSSAGIIGQPVLLYRGIIDACEIEDSFENPTATISLENDLSRFDTSQNYRFSKESQRAYFPDDRGFDYVEKLEDWSGFWGKSERPKFLRKQRSRKSDG